MRCEDKWKNRLVMGTIGSVLNTLNIMFVHHSSTDVE